MVQVRATLTCMYLTITWSGSGTGYYCIYRTLRPDVKGYVLTISYLAVSWNSLSIGYYGPCVQVPTNDVPCGHLEGFRYCRLEESTLRRWCTLRSSLLTTGLTPCLLSSSFLESVNKSAITRQKKYSRKRHFTRIVNKCF